MTRKAYNTYDPFVQLEVLETDDRARHRRLPPWLKRPLPFGDFASTKNIVADSGVATVCEDAKCPNLNECWSRGTATFMIMGHDCTRRCHYCAVNTARPDALDADEPRRLALAARDMGLKHVVITAVARDDLPDEGAAHFAECVRQLRSCAPDATVEILPADMHARAECIRKMVEADPDIFNHNIETVERLHPPIRPQGKYDRSLKVLELVKALAPEMPTKSGIMVGLGETHAELSRTFEDLQRVGCDILTVGQYLQPSRSDHAPVRKYYRPEEFEDLAEEAREIGFSYVYAGPFVRSSYNAGEVFASLLGGLDARTMEQI